MKLFLLVVGLIVSANAAAVKQVDKAEAEASIDAAVEYFKAPEALASSTQANNIQATSTQATSTQEISTQSSSTQASTSTVPAQEDAEAAAPTDKVEETATAPTAPVAVPTNVTHHAAVPVVPMSEFISNAKTPEEQQQLQKSVEAWRKYKKDLYVALNHCQVLHNVSAAVSDKLMNIEMEHVGHKEQCYVHCVLENLHEYADNTVQAENMRDAVGLIVGMERLNKVLDKCQHIKGDNLCESAYKFFECYRQGMFDMRNAEDNPLKVYAWVVQ